ncbi:hypothetical protein BDQ17DRAFT_1546052 [Cyathus striatus]|nr:hypothetical protein BDQ17DRAFT_1546052 [Cyathus striatus]
MPFFVGASMNLGADINPSIVRDNPAFFGRARDITINGVEYRRNYNDIPRRQASAQTTGRAPFTSNTPVNVNNVYVNNGGYSRGSTTTWSSTNNHIPRRQAQAQPSVNNDHIEDYIRAQEDMVRSAVRGAEEAVRRTADFLQEFGIASSPRSSSYSYSTSARAHRTSTTAYRQAPDSEIEIVELVSPEVNREDMEQINRNRLRACSRTETKASRATEEVAKPEDSAPHIGPKILSSKESFLKTTTNASSSISSFSPPASPALSTPPSTSSSATIRPPTLSTKNGSMASLETLCAVQNDKHVDDTDTSKEKSNGSKPKRSFVAKMFKFMRRLVRCK